MIIKHTPLQYWNARSQLFADYYIKPSRFNQIFRKGIFTRARVAMEVIKAIENPKILDVGCGPGINMTNWIKSNPNAHITGIDFAPKMIEFANKMMNKEGLMNQSRLILDDFVSHNFESEKFEIVLALGVFDYTSEAQEILNKMKSLSTKFVIGSWPRNGIRMTIRRLRYTCPLFHYNEKQVISMHHKIGISNVKISSCSNVGFTTVAEI